MNTGDDFTRLLERAAAGDAEAHERVAELAYERLHELALARMSRERNDHTLQPTALVGEAWMRLHKSSVSPNDRNHYMALAASTMRRVLIDHERERRALKRLGNLRRVEMPIDLVDDQNEETRMLDLLDVDTLLTELATIDETRAQIVEMRLFAGMETRAIAETLDLSRSIVQRHLQSAPAWMEVRLDRASSS